MSDESVTAAALAASLQRVRRGVLLTLATCAVVIALTAAAEAPDPARAYPIAAVGLALASIVTRQIGATAAPRTRVRLALASLMLAACVGLVGVSLALNGGPRGTALAYTLGAAILCLTPPAGLARR